MPVFDLLALRAGLRLNLAVGPLGEVLKGNTDKYMRVIQLSPKDTDMATREMVDTFFLKKLPNRDPLGKFRLTRTRVAEDGLSPGERLLFAYKGQCVYQARVLRGRVENEDAKREIYPYYFCVDVDSLVKTTGRLSDLEQELHQLSLVNKSLHSAGWTSIDETLELRNALDRILGTV